MFRELLEGPLKVFEEPQSQKKYCIGSDVAMGLADGDYSTAFVMDQDWNQVAALHEHIHPDLLGAKLYRLGMWYNKALVAIEENNHGLTTITRLKNDGYSNIYMRTVKDERAEMYTKKLGWSTNSKTKMLMLDEFVAAVRDGNLLIRDVDLLKEMITLSVEHGGDVNLNGKDRVVSACIAVQAYKQLITSKLGASYPKKAGIKWKENSLPSIKEASKLVERKRDGNFD